MQKRENYASRCTAQAYQIRTCAPVQRNFRLVLARSI